MLTLRGVFTDGQIAFLEDVPLTGQCQVLVTFLNVEDEMVVASNEECGVPLDHTGANRPSLTSRELQVLGLAQKGLRTKEIAGELGISDGTVRNYLSSIYGKFKVRNRLEAVRKAVELGLLLPLRGG